jgi:hypothetical protein
MLKIHDGVLYNRRDPMHKGDPYVALIFDEEEKGCTSVCTNTLEPVWNESLSVLLLFIYLFILVLLLLLLLLYICFYTIFNYIYYLLNFLLPRILNKNKITRC